MNVAGSGVGSLFHEEYGLGIDSVLELTHCSIGYFRITSLCAARHCQFPPLSTYDLSGGGDGVVEALPSAILERRQLNMKCSKSKPRANRGMDVFLVVMNGLNILLQVLLKVENLVKHLKQ